MKYAYDSQERRYQSLRALGTAVDYAGRSFDQFDLRPFLEQVLPTLMFSTPRPRVLEYGTGTGPGACFLAARGFQVDAIDLAPTAIELARAFAAQRRLEVNFEVRDICSLGDRKETYDLVIDNFCRHRLITDEERRRAAGVVREALKSTGYFIIGTVVYRADRVLGEDRYDPATGILYRKLATDSHDYDDAVCWADGWRAPVARHLCAERIRAELECSGFRVLRQDGGRVLCDKGIV